MIFSKTLRSNLIYAAGSVSNALALFLLLPYLINALAATEYGRWVLIELQLTVLSTIFLAGLDSGVMRYYWSLKEEVDRKYLIGTALIAAFGWSLFLTFTGIILHRFTPLWTWASLEGVEVILVLSICSIETLFTIYLALFRIRDKPIHFASLSGLKLILFLILTVTIVRSGLGVPGILIARLISSTIVLILAIGLATNELSLKLNLSNLSRIIAYGSPLIPQNLAVLILLASDRYFLRAYTTLETVAYYSFAYKIATLIDVLVTRPFAVDWAARRFTIVLADQPRTRFSQAQMIYTFVIVSFSLALIAANPLLYKFLAPANYATSADLVPVIILANIFYGLSYPLNVGIMLKDKTYYLPYVAWGAALCCILFNYIFIPIYGVWGAAWVTVFVYGIYTFAIGGLSQKLYPVDYNGKVIIWLIILAALGYIVIRMANDFILPLNAFAYVAVVVTGVTLLWIAVVNRIGTLYRINFQQQIALFNTKILMRK